MSLSRPLFAVVNRFGLLDSSLSLSLSLALRASVTLRGEQLLHRGGVRLGPVVVVVVVAATAHGRCHRTAYLLSHSHRSLGDGGEREARP